MGQFLLYTFIGAILCLTPIPHMPIIYLAAVAESGGSTLWSKLLCAIFNVWMPALPVLCLAGAYKQAGEAGLAGIVCGGVIVWLVMKQHERK